MTQQTEKRYWRVCQKCRRKWERRLNLRTGAVLISWQSGCETPEQCCRELFGHGLPPNAAKVIGASQS